MRKAYRQPTRRRCPGGALEPRTFAHAGAGAYVQASAAVAQAFEDLTNGSDADWTVIYVMQSDMSLGAATVLRVFCEGWTASATNEAWSNFRDFSGGSEDHLRVAAIGGGSTLEDLGGSGDPGAGPSIVDGDIHFVVSADIGSAGAGQIKGGADGAALANAPGTWARASMGAIDYYSPVGGTRGATPTRYSPLGWSYFHALVDEDLTGDYATLWTAFNNALAGDDRNMNRACNALLTAIRAAATSDAAILYARTYRAGAAAAFGDDSDSGLVYVEPGVSP